MLEDIRDSPGSIGLDRGLRDRLEAAAADAPIYEKARRDVVDSRRIFDNVMKILYGDAAGSGS